MTTAHLSGLTARYAEPYELPVSGSLAAARWATLAAGISLLISAVLGLRYGEQGLYQSEALLLPQFYGQDVVALVVVLPLMLLSARRARHGSARALIAWAGALTYVAYWYHFYLGGIPFGPLFLPHVVVVGSSLFALGVLIARVDVQRLARRFSDALPARSLGGMMVTAGAVFATAWILDVMERLGHGEVLDRAAVGIYSVDLTLMLPITVVAGFLLWSHAPWGYLLSGPLLINAFLSILTLSTTWVIVRFAGVTVPGVEMAAFWLATLVMGGCVAIFMRALRV